MYTLLSEEVGHVSRDQPPQHCCVADCYLVLCGLMNNINYHSIAGKPQSLEAAVHYKNGYTALVSVLFLLQISIPLTKFLEGLMWSCKLHSYTHPQTTPTCT